MIDVLVRGLLQTQVLVLGVLGASVAFGRGESWNPKQPVSPSVATLTNEARYIEWKWREDVADPSTGFGAEVLREELAKRLPEWKRTMSWSEAKARAFAYLCDRTAIDVSRLDWFPTFAYWTRHTDNLHPILPQLLKRRDEVMAARHPGLKDHWPYWCGYPDFDHSAPDWDDVIAVGFKGMEDRLLKNWKDTSYYPPRKATIDAVFHLLDRLIAQGERKKGGGRRCTEDIQAD